MKGWTRIGAGCWCVYRRPSDFPNQYVARWHNPEGPTALVMIAKSIWKIRREMILNGLFRIPRQPEDDAVIVETWH